MAYKIPDQLSFLVTGRMKQKSYSDKCHDKIVLITGATSGIGYVTALKFARMGAQLIIVARNIDKVNKIVTLINSENLKTPLFYITDFTNLDDVKSIGEKIITENSRIDILINNAGMYRTKKYILKSGIDSVFTVNHLSSFLLTKVLIPSLKNSNDARVININSEGHRFGNVNLNDLGYKKQLYTGLRSYGASKTAQLHTMYIFKKELNNNGIRILSMHPGAVKSNIGSHSGWLYNFYMNYILSHFLKDPNISADAIYYLSLSGEIKDGNGKFYNLTNVEIPAPHAQESKRSIEIYNKSLELIEYE